MVEKTRTDLLNFLAEKHDLKQYLEIGVQDPEQNFDKITCPKKFAVDPSADARGMYYNIVRRHEFMNTESDNFFKYWAGVDGIIEFPRIDGAPLKYTKLFDLIFIDGLHTAEQVKKDFENALKVLSPDGFIVLHDCNPEKEEHTIVPRPTERGHWNGDVYKFAVQIRDCGHTVDIDNGCFVYQNTEQKRDKIFPMWKGERRLNNYRVRYTWEDFDKNRAKYLNLITWDEFVKIH